MHKTLNLDLPAFSDQVIQWINSVLPLLPVVILVLLVGILIVRIVVRTLKFIFAVTIIHEALRNVLVSVIEIILWILLAVEVLQTMGFQNVIVFFTGSIAAVGLAMAAGGSTLVADIIAGIFLARDIDFDVGDEVIAGETPTQGVVESIDARRTRIRDKDGVLHIIPNSIVERKEWVLVSKRPEVSALVQAVKTVRRIRRAAAVKTQAMNEKSLIAKKKRVVRKNAQSQPVVDTDTIQE